MIGRMPPGRTGRQTLAVGAAVCAIASCSQVLELDQDYTLGPANSTSGAGGGGGSGTGGSTSTGGNGAECPDGQQDNDGDGTCEPTCAADTCSGNGTCDDSSGTATCTCEDRFSGDACDSCAEGYEGNDCTACASGYQDNDDDGSCLPECDFPPCSGNGACDDSSGTAICTCRADFTGDDCATACGQDMAGPDCAFRIIYGLDIPAAVPDWNAVADVPYDVDDAASADPFDRVAYRLMLDTQEVWVELDPFTTDATELGMPMEVVFDVAVTDVTVISLSANQPSIPTPSAGNVEMWSNCYSAGPNGVFDYDDDISATTDCYGCIQVHVGTETVLAFNRWSSSSGNLDIGIGTSPTGNPDYTFRQNAPDYTTRRLEVYIREP
jgi:hypothetical protein